MYATCHNTKVTRAFWPLLLFLLSPAFCSSQSIAAAYNIFQATEKGIRTPAVVSEGDTIPVINLNAVEINTEFVFKTARHREMWTRTKHNVKIVYPYAIMAGAKLKEYDAALARITTEKERKAYLKKCEKDLRAEFEDELKELSITQGIILMKLINRETGKTTYDVVKQMRGSFQAAMWQTVARVFGHNMKVEYDSQVEDIMIERAIKLVETGLF